MKQCRKCNIELIVGENWTESQFKCKNYMCKNCLRLYYENNKDRKIEKAKEYYENNKEKITERNKEYYENNKEKITERNKEYYENNKEKVKENNKEYRENNKERIKEYRENAKEKSRENSKEYYENNIEKIKANKKEYRARPETKKKTNERRKLRRQTDPWFDAQCKLRNASHRLIKNCLTGCKKDFSGVNDLGCGKEVFLAHIESLFQPGMTWENRGKNGWHYDHILPICNIDPNDKEAVLKVLHYTNIQPLWAIDNLKKISEDKKKSIRYKYNK